MRSEDIQSQLVKDPKNPDLLVRYGRALYTERKYDQALGCFFRALEKAPRHPRIYAFIASTLKKMRAYSEAARYFYLAFEGGHNRPGTLENLIYSLRISGNVKSARDLTQRFEESDLLTPNVANLIAMDSFNQGDFEKSERFLSKAMADNSSDLFFQSLGDTLNAVSPDHKSKHKIAFHLNQLFHYHIMKPLFDSLSEDYHCLMTADLLTLREFEPEVVFVANSQATPIREFLPNACFIYTRHGLISKNFVFQAVKGCDFVMVPGPDQKQEFVQRGSLPEERVWITGYSQMDPLFRGETGPLGYEIDKTKKTVLYAPTFTPGLSSIPAMSSYLEANPECFDDLNVIMKLHPMAPEIYPREWRALKHLCHTKENMHFAEAGSDNIVNYLAVADVLVSDLSSVVFQFLAVDRPIITFNHPERRNSPQYDAEGLEWRWRDMGIEIDRMQDLRPEINEALKDPSSKQEIRKKYKELLFGDVVDGRTGERVKANLQEFFRNAEKVS